MAKGDVIGISLNNAENTNKKIIGAASEKGIARYNQVQIENVSGTVTNSIDANNDGYVDLLDLVKAKKETAKSSGIKKEINKSATEKIGNVLLTDMATNDSRFVRKFNDYVKKNNNKEALSDKELKDFVDTVDYLRGSNNQSESNRNIYEKTYNLLSENILQRDKVKASIKKAKSEMDNAKSELDSDKIFGGKLDGDKIKKVLKSNPFAPVDEEKQNKGIKKYAEAAAKYYALSEGLDTQEKIEKELKKKNLSKEKRDALSYILYGTDSNAFTNIIKNIDASRKSILPGILSTVEKTGDATIGLAVNKLGNLFGYKGNIIEPSGSGVQEYAEKQNFEIANRSMAYGDKLNVVGTVSQAIASTLPSVAVTYATGGLASPSILTQSSGIKGLIKNPAFWTSSMAEYGNTFYEYKKSGASDLKATMYALPASLIKGYIEIGGGTEKLISEISKGAGDKALKEWFISALEEGGEETLQGTVDEIFRRFATGDTDFSQEKIEDFIQNNIQEAIGGFIGGAFLGAGSLTVNKIANLSTEAEYEELAKTVKQTTDIDSIINYAKTCDNIEIRSIAENENITDAQIGQIYSYMCKDITTAINTTKSFDNTLNVLADFVNQIGNDNPIVAGIIIPQVLDKSRAFDISADEAASSIADVLIKNEDKASNDYDGELFYGEDEVNTNTGEAESGFFTEPKKRDIIEEPNAEQRKKATELTVRHIENVAKKLNPKLNVVVVDTIHYNNGKVNPNANGKYVRKTNTLYLKKGLAVAESYTELFKHEFMHSLESKKLYDSFKDYLFKESKAFYNFARFILRNAENENAESGKTVVFEEVKNEYLKRGYKENNWEYELVADFFAKQLLTGKYRTAISKQIKNDDFAESVPAEEQLGILEELKVKKPSLLQRIKDIIRELINKLRGYPQAKSIETDLTYLDNYVERLINGKNIKNTDKNAGERFSFSEKLFDKKDIIDLSLDEELLIRIKNSEKSSITEMRDYIFEKLGGVKLKLSDGINAIVDNSDAKHIANRGKNNMQKSEISNIENIIKNAKYYNKVSATHPKFTNFRYYEIPVKFGETIAFVTVNVGYGKTDSQYHIYDLTEPKERNTPNRINGFAGPVGNLLRKGVSNNIISASEEKSQEEFSNGMTERLRGNNVDNHSEGVYSIYELRVIRILLAREKFASIIDKSEELEQKLKDLRKKPNYSQSEYLALENQFKKIQKERYEKAVEFDSALLNGTSEDYEYAYNYSAGDNIKYANLVNDFKSLPNWENININKLINEADEEHLSEINVLKESSSPIPINWTTEKSENTNLQNNKENIAAEHTSSFASKTGYSETYIQKPQNNTQEVKRESQNQTSPYKPLFEQLRYNPEAYIKRLLKNCKIPANEENVKYYSDELKAITRLHNKGKGSRAEYEFSLKAMASELAENIPDTITDLSKEVISYIKGKKVSLTKTQIDEIESLYGSIKEWSKVTGLKVSDDAIGLDTLWQEMSDEYSGYFDSDTNEGDEVSRIYDVIEKAKSDFEERDDNFTAERIYKVLDNVLKNTGKQGEKKRTLSILEEYKEKERIKAEKRNYIKVKNEEQAKVKKISHRFERAITKPTKRNYIPISLYKTCEKLLKSLDGIINSDTVAAESKYGQTLSEMLYEIRKNEEIINAIEKAKTDEERDHIIKINNAQFIEEKNELLKSDYIETYYKAIESNKFGRGVELEKLSQEIELAESEEERNKLIKRYNRIFTGERDFNANFDNVMFEIKKVLKKENEDGDFVYSDTFKNFEDLRKRLLGKVPVFYDAGDWNAINNAFADLYHTIDNYNKLIGKANAKEIGDSGRAMIDEIKRSVKLSSIREASQIRFMDTISFFKRLGNYEKDSEWSKWAKRLNDGAHKKIEYKRLALARFIELNENPKTKEMFDVKNLVDAGLRNKAGETVLVPKEFRLKLAMDSLDEKAYNHLLVNGITLPKSFNKYYQQGLSSKETFKQLCFLKNPQKWQEEIFSSLSEIEKEWFEAIRDYYKFSGEELNNVFFKLHGYYRTMYDNYSHIIVDSSFLSTMFGKTQDGNTNIRPGYMEERTGDVKTLYGVGAISQLLRDIDSHADYIGLAIPIYNFNRAYNFSVLGKLGEDGTPNPAMFGTAVSVKSALEEKFNKLATNYIEDMMSDLIGNTRQTGAKGAQAIKRLTARIKGNYAQAVLSANMRVAFTQTASFPMAYAVLDAKSMLKAAMFIEDQNGKKHYLIAKADREMIDEITSLVWYRTKGFKNGDIGDTVDRLGHTVSEKLADKLPHILKWVNMFDETTINRLAYASMFYVQDHFDFKKGSKEYNEKVKEIFERVIEETQPNYTTLQRSPFMRWGAKSELGGAIAMFKTVPTMQLNRLIDATMELKTKKSQKGRFSKSEIKEAKVNMAKTLTAVLVSNLQLVILRAIVDALLNGFKRYRDDDDEVTAESVALGIIKDFIETPLGMFPILGDLLTGFVEKIFNGKYDFYGVTMPQLETINNLTEDVANFSSALEDVVKSLSGEKFDYEAEFKKISGIIEDTGGAFGYPVKNIKNTLLGLYYTTDDIIDKLKNDGEFFNTAIENNTLNRFFSPYSIQKQSQKVSVIIKTLEDGKDASGLISDFKKEYPDKDIFNEIIEIYKKDKDVIENAKKDLASVKRRKEYKALSDDQKKAVESELKKYHAEEKVIKATKHNPKMFDNLFNLKNKNNKKYKEEREKLIKEGYTDYQINNGLKYAEYRLVDSMGIDIAKYIAANKYVSPNVKEKYADINKDGKVKKAERRKTLEKLGYTKKEIDIILNK